MKSKLVKCGSQAYYVEIVAQSHVAVFRDDSGTPGWGRRLGRTSTFDDALTIIKADAGSKRVTVRDCLT